MSHIRARLASLPFVSVRDSGTLNMWDVAEPGQTSRCYDFGRRCAALLIATMREFQNPSLLHHVMRAQAESRSRSHEVQAAFCEEVSRSIMASPWASLPLLTVPLPRGVGPDSDLAGVLDALPFTARLNGRIAPFAPRVTGDYEQDCATGRYYGAALVHAVHRTRWTDLLCRAKRHVDAAGLAGGLVAIRVGAEHVMAEAAMAADPEATQYGRGAAAFLSASTEAHFEAPTRAPTATVEF